MQRLLLSSISELCSNYFNFMSDCVFDFPKVIWCQRGFHSSLLPIASEGRPDVLKLCSNYFTFSFKLMKSAILWKGVIVVSIWSVKPRWVDHQLAIMASCIPWKPPFRTLLSKESKEFWTIWNFYQMGSFQVLSYFQICIFLSQFL